MTNSIECQSTHFTGPASAWRIPRVPFCCNEFKTRKTVAFVHNPIKLNLHQPIAAASRSRPKGETLVERRRVELPAKASWIIALLTGPLNLGVVVNDPTIRFYSAIVVVLLAALGFIVGCLAMSRALRAGKERTFRHALAGIMMNGAILFFLIFVLVEKPPVPPTAPPNSHPTFRLRS